MDCAFDDDRTIVVAKMDFAISANVVLYILKSLFSPFRPHDHIPYAIGKTGRMACNIYTTKPAASRMVGHAEALGLGD